MIIDIHGHYTTEPQQLLTFRDKQLAGLADAMRRPTSTDLGISDEELVKSVQPQIKLPDVFRGIILFFVADVITIAGLIMFPEIVTWLPDVLGVR